MVYIYFRPHVIDYNYNFIAYVYNYINDNQIEIANSIGYDFNFRDINNQNFIKYFNGANNLLLYLFNQKKNNDMGKKLIKEKNKDINYLYSHIKNTE